MSTYKLTFIFFIYLIVPNNGYQYPDARRNESVVDNYFGTLVKDPYRWLENPESNETKQFIKAQNNVFKEYIDKNKFRADIEKDFRDFLNYPKYSIPSKRGSKYYYTSNDGLQNQPVWYSLDEFSSVGSSRKVFLDPNKLHPNSTTSLKFVSFSPDGKYCAYGFSEGGSDWTSIRIRNTETLQDLPEVVTKIKFSQATWTTDNLGFFYGGFDQFHGYNTTNSSKLINMTLLYHRINTDQSADIRVAEFPKTPFRIVGTPAVSTCNHIHLFPFGDGQETWLVAKFQLPITGPLEFTTLAVGSFYQYVANNDDIAYMLTNFNAPKHKIIKVNLTDWDYRKWVDIIPEHPTNMLNDVVAVDKNYVAAVYTQNVSQVIKIFRLTDGKHVKDLQHPLGISIHSVKANRDSAELFYKRTSFLLPEICYKYNMNSGDRKVFRQSAIKGINLEDYVIKQIFIESKDKKVHVPMYIVHKKSLKMDGNNPTLIQFYAGFGISRLPGYSPLTMFFVSRLNGIYVQVNARGGGEYGQNWHSSAAGFHKQNGFDDIISATEYMIEKNYTKRDLITIEGASNAGMMVAALANQRQYLFGAIIAHVGVMDMLRYPLFTIGYTWLEEYGDPQGDEQDFRYIYRYSPLHNIPNNTKRFPAVLALTADMDDRVVPAHSYKYMAQLQHQLGHKLFNTPLMLKVDTNSGHGGGKPMSKHIEQYADIIIFIMNALKINYIGE